MFENLIKRFKKEQRRITTFLHVFLIVCFAENQGGHYAIHRKDYDVESSLKQNLGFCNAYETLHKTARIDGFVHYYD